MYRMQNGQRQLNLFEDFKFPLGELNPTNRWVVLSQEIPWSAIEIEYAKLFPSTQGKPGIDVRIAFGSLLIQKQLNCTDEELVKQVGENPYLQWFLGAKEFTMKPLFARTSLVEFRKRMTTEFLEKANELIINYKKEEDEEDNDGDNDKDFDDEASDTFSTEAVESKQANNKGTLILDATCTPASIGYPNDIKLLNDCRVALEGIIDEAHEMSDEKKPRTYRQEARKEYLNFAKSKQRGAKKIRRHRRKQLAYVRRNLGYVDNYLSSGIVFSSKIIALMLTIRLIFSQQEEMHNENKRTVSDRIVSLFQPHVRTMVRGKAKAKFEFGAKVEVSIVDGFTRIFKLSWAAYNEGVGLREAIEDYKKRTGYYPERVLADQLYRNRQNLNYCKERGIRLSGKSLGRPKKDQTVDKRVEYQDNSDRNAVEGKFGEAKLRYGLDRLATKLQETSETEIHISVIAMNLSRKLRIKFISCFFFFLKEGLLLA